MKALLRHLGVIASISTMLTFCDGGSYLPAIAGEINSLQPRSGVLRIPVEIATGNSANRIPLIELSPGYGVNISFIPTGEIVEKVWLDNPAIATLDVDGCLAGLGRECENQGATVLHLRRINPLNVPGLPKTNSSLLTVVTKGNSGRRLYLFRVARGGNSPKYHTIEVTPTANQESETRNVFSQYQSWHVISRGLEIARQQRLIMHNSPLWNRINNFLASLNIGESIEVAAQKNGISLQLVNRLIELGKTTPVQTFEDLP